MLEPCPVQSNVNASNPFVYLCVGQSSGASDKLRDELQVLFCLDFLAQYGVKHSNEQNESVVFDELFHPGKRLSCDGKSEDCGMGYRIARTLQLEDGLGRSVFGLLFCDAFLLLANQHPLLVLWQELHFSSFVYICDVDLILCVSNEKKKTFAISTAHLLSGILRWIV
jgi:hypothetical protein